MSWRVFFWIVRSGPYHQMMVDPGSAAVAIGAANAGTSLAMNVGKGLGAMRRGFQLLGTFEPGWLSLRPDSDFHLSAGDVEDIEKFLSSTQMEPVLAFLLISELSKSSPNRGQALATFETVFDNEADRWLAASGGKWKKRKEDVRMRLRSLYDNSLGFHSECISSDDLDGYEHFINSPILNGAGKSSNSGRHLERLVELMKDLSSLTRAVGISRDLARTISSVQHQPIINHTELDSSSDFESLYIRRNFVSDEDHQVFAADDLNPSSSPFRAVVMGDPGAGKTTFVQHFKKEISGMDSGVPVVEIVCRHYAKMEWDKSIITHAVESINADHSMRLSAQDFESILLLGRVCLVFDGLDEITERTRRSEMITRIESIASQYPVCSILVTTRLLGYDRAPLPAILFSHLRLDQFDGHQFEEYCERWFGQRGRNDLVESFIRDSESVSDLRYNPLMLSLMCALYREHGSLPTDRRGVYQRCADLLFRRWDDHRQIEQPGAMPQYAERLMQEIARWVYTSASVQDGIEENQLVMVLAHSLVDRDGFDQSDAERDSRSFVEFCAGRAWLLASFGTNHRGQRMFRFTHRTFLEYFAAESFVRRSESQDQICQEIKRVYEEDATSVVPELLIQAYDFRRDGGGTAVFKQLLQEGSHNLLLLRLMEGIGMPSHFRRQAFLRIFSIWESEEWVSPSELELVLSLNEQARGQLVREFLVADAGPNHDAARSCLIKAWAGLELSGYRSRFHDYWSPIVDEIARDMEARGVTPVSQATANWLISRHIEPRDYGWRGWDAVVCQSNYGAVPGLIWWNIDARLGRSEDLLDNQFRDNAIYEAYTQISNGAKIPEPLLEGLRSCIVWSGAEYLAWGLPDGYPNAPLDEILTNILLYVIFAFHESEEDVEFFISLTSKLFGEGLSAALELRDFNVQIGPRTSRGRELLAREFVGRFPQWLRRWVDGRSAFVLRSDEVK
ncbi:NACHT domain-containing protein [Rhodococcus artemisiae]|uniref:NACHT domain-containing protein n=1 Tax=Rhodococcus artemisiae TaxID=714159 RepID=A0ABU7L8B2_9NOCA|nr:NACHT domain-containing protein [Rhodococcus artemisiae]MEE2057781.1 NACHT domain-containing protein [Rhodococcus artemisiae]